MPKRKTDRPNWSRVYHWFIRDLGPALEALGEKPLTDIEFRVFVTINDRAQDAYTKIGGQKVDGYYGLTIPDIARTIGRGTTATRDAIFRLRELGLVQVIQSNGGKSRGHAYSTVENMPPRYLEALETLRADGGYDAKPYAQSRGYEAETLRPGVGAVGRPEGWRPEGDTHHAPAARAASAWTDPDDTTDTWPWV